MWSLVAISLTVVGMPMLFSPGSAPEESAVVSVVAGPEAAVEGPPPTVVAEPPPPAQQPPELAPSGDGEPSQGTATTEPEPTTTTSVAPETTTTEPPTTTEAPETTTTTEAPPARTLAKAPPPAPAPTTTTAPPPPPAPESGVQEGTATWYDLPGARAGVCAHRTIPKGTVVTVTHLGTGKSITCTVDDRGPYAGGHILDLHKDDFVGLAPLSVGVIPIRLTW